MDLGFYYMANAMGRLVGTLVGGFLYHYTVSTPVKMRARLVFFPQRFALTAVPSGLIARDARTLQRRLVAQEGSSECIAPTFALLANFASI